VVAIQHGRAIFTMAVSFHRNEPSMEHQATMPVVPKPEELPSEAELKERVLPMMPDPVRRYYERERPIELRPVEYSRYIGKNLEQIAREKIETEGKLVELKARFEKERDLVAKIRDLRARIEAAVSATASAAAATAGAPAQGTAEVAQATDVEALRSELSELNAQLTELQGETPLFGAPPGNDARYVEHLGLMRELGVNTRRLLRSQQLPTTVDKAA
jgi:hypothetical protein